jgi:fatty acid desaturase
MTSRGWPSAISEGAAVPHARGRVPRELVVPPRLAPLLRAAAFDWAVILACWAVMAWAPAWCLPPAVLVVASRLHALGVVLHDACHLRRTGHPGWRLLEVVAGYPITTTLAAMRYHHLRHHRHNGTARDPYLKPGASHRWWPAVAGRLRGLLLPPAWVLRAWFGCLALAWPALRDPYRRVFLGDTALVPPHDRDHDLLACLHAERGQALFFLLLVPVALAWPLEFAVGYVLPLCIAGLCNANRVIAEHLHPACAPGRTAVPSASGRDHIGGWLGWLLYPRNIGYHEVHHLHPEASMRSLPEIHAWYLRNAPGPRSEGDRDAASHGCAPMR